MVSEKEEPTTSTKNGNLSDRPTLLKTCTLPFKKKREKSKNSRACRQFNIVLDLRCQATCCFFSLLSCDQCKSHKNMLECFSVVLCFAHVAT